MGEWEGDCESMGGEWECGRRGVSVVGEGKESVRVEWENVCK